MFARYVRGRTSPVFLVVLVLALLAIVTGGASTGIAAPQANFTPSATTATVAQQHQGASVAGSGEYYYYYQGNKIPLRPAPNRFVVKFREGVTIAQAQSSFQQQGLRETETIDRRSLHIVEAEQAGLSVIDLTRSPEIEYATPVLLALDDSDIVILNEFLVKFKPTASEDDVRRLNALYQAEVVEELSSSGVYLLRVPWNSSFTGLDVANTYYESGLAEFATPNWIESASIAFFPPGDEHFSEQWALDASHLDALRAWDVYSAYPDPAEVIVAVLDTGVELNHPDLAGRLVQGYDAVYEDNDPSPGNNELDAHGTAVTGVIVAAMNDRGVVGIAPNMGMEALPTVKVMPVRVVAPIQDQCHQQIEPLWVARGIWHAVANGAAVINLSLGIDSEDGVRDAIMHAVQNGRNGKGTLVVAASGNDGEAQIHFPASDPHVLAVGATMENDRRAKWGRESCPPYRPETGSNYGDGLDIVAPGDNIWTTDVTDIPGRRGFCSGAYCGGLPGTSFAAPYAAGVAALVISQYPSLFESDVRLILQNSADKVHQNDPSNPYRYDSNGRNEEVGYGRLNARRALVQPLPPLTAPDLIGPTNQSTTSSLRPGFDWTDVSGAVRYVIAISESPDFAPIDVLGQPTVSAFTPPTDLKPNTQYFWRVHAVREYQPGPFSAVWSFRTPDVPHDCINNAAFDGYETIPDGTPVQAGQTLDKAWRMRNTGTCTWGTDYGLAFVDGNQMGARNFVNIPQETRPGETVIIHVLMTASGAGTQTGSWRMADPQGNKFGQRVWIQVFVTGSDCITIVGTDYPRLVKGGQTFVPKVRVRLLTGDLRESRGDMLACYEGAAGQDPATVSPGCYITPTLRYGAFPHVPVIGTASAGQEYTFNFGDVGGNQMTAPGSDGEPPVSRWRIWRNGSWATCADPVEIAFTVDATGPSVSLLQPPNGAFINSNANIELYADASDASGVTRVTFQYNDGSWHDISTDGDGSDGWRATWNPAGAADRRDLLLRARAEDRLDNANEATNQVTLDRTPPSSAVDRLPARQPQPSFQVSWAGSDNVSGIQAYRIQYRAAAVGAAAAGDWTDWYVGSQTTASFNGELGHTYCFQSSAIDAAGNVEAYPGGDGDACTRVSAIGAQFAALPVSGTAPLTVTFTDLSQGAGITSWTWDFGDGTPTMTGAGPHTHVYGSRGSYVASLTISNGAETSAAQQTIVVYERAIADFTATPARGVVSLTVAFANRSTGDYTALTWDFGDGSPATHDANPTHRYEQIGSYTATLQVSGPGGSDSKAVIITVTPPFGDMVGHVDLQGRPMPPNDRWAMPLTLTLIRDQAAATTATVQADAAGYFTVTLTPGSYQALVKHAHTLARKATFTILGGDTVPAAFPTLWEGDASDSNAVEQADVNILAASYNRGLGGAGYDGRADFNVDEFVGIADLSLLASNFGRTGDTAAPVATDAGGRPHVYLPMATAGGDARLSAGAAGLAAGGEQTPQAPAGLALSALARVAPGAVFALEIRGDSGGEAVDAAEAHLAFDPALLEVVDVTPDSAWGAAVLNEYDNAAGALAYAAGNFSGKPVRGSFVLATVHFRARAEGRATLALQAKPLRGETALYGGGTRLALASAGAEKAINVERSGSRTPGHQSLLPNALRPAPTAATTVTLEFASDPANVPVGRLAQVSLYVDAGAQPVDAVDLYINFDPQKISITDASGTAASEIYRDASVMPLSPLLNRVDNAAGQIDFAAGVAGGSATGRFRVGYFYVYALSPGGIADLRLNHDGQRNSSAYLLGFPVPIGLRDIAIPIEVPEPATLLLLGSGIAGLAAYARRRRQAR